MHAPAIRGCVFGQVIVLVLALQSVQVGEELSDGKDVFMHSGGEGLAWSHAFQSCAVKQVCSQIHQMHLGEFMDS